MARVLRPAGAGNSEVLDDILLLARGDLAVLISVARAAVLDFRDMRVAADAERANNE